MKNIFGQLSIFLSSADITAPLRYYTPPFFNNWNIRAGLPECLIQEKGKAGRAAR